MCHSARRLALVLLVRCAVSIERDAILRAVGSSIGKGNGDCSCQVQDLKEPFLEPVEPPAVQGHTFLRKKTLQHRGKQVTLFEFKQPGDLSSEELPFKLLTLRRVDETGLQVRSVPHEHAINSWFPGYAWSILVCDKCGGHHLGWKFTSTVEAGEHFYALIVEEDHDVLASNKARARSEALQDPRKPRRASVPAFLTKHLDKVNIAVLGLPGTGRTSFVDAARGLSPQPQAASRELRPLSYDLPKEPHALLWDMPAFGAEGWPWEAYWHRAGLLSFDVMIFVTDRDWQPGVVALAQALVEQDREVFMVRQKLVLAIDDLDAKTSADRIQKLQEELAGQGFTEVYALDSNAPANFDFPRLMDDVRSLIRFNDKYVHWDL